MGFNFRWSWRPWNNEMTGMWYLVWFQHRKVRMMNQKRCLKIIVLQLHTHFPSCSYCFSWKDGFHHDGGVGSKEMGRPATPCKLGAKRVRSVRCRGGNMKYRALRLDSGNYAWGSEPCQRWKWLPRELGWMIWDLMASQRNCKKNTAKWSRYKGAETC